MLAPGSCQTTYVSRLSIASPLAATGVPISAANRALLQFALQGAPVHAERPGGGGNVAFMLGQYALDMLPLQAVDRHRVFRHQAVEVGVLGKQRGEYVVGVGR